MFKPMIERLEPWQRSSHRPVETIEQLYETLGSLLLGELTERLGVPADKAGPMLQEVFAAYLTSRSSSDPKQWLIAATCLAGEAYQRRVAREQNERRALPEVTPDELKALRNPKLMRELLAALPAVAREAVRLRFRECRSYEEIAEELDVSTVYVKRLVTKAVQAVVLLRERRQAGKDIR